MRASDHTARLLEWWRHHDVDRVDLAVRFATGAWVAHHDLPLPAADHVTWARACNVRRADIYVRPARRSPWPHVFLDDLPASTARLLLARYRAMIVHTSLKDSLAVQLLENGCDPRYLAALFGHADLQSVRKYQRLSVQRLQEVHRRCHPAEQPRSGCGEV